MKPVTYEDSGVNVKKADGLIDDIRSRIQRTFNPHVLNTIGGFAALTEVPKGYINPVLVSSTDGVGTKLKIAFIADKHDTVGIDLVGMSVNDILTLGARPLFFLDYYASGKIEDRVYKEVISGICDGCEMAACALVGGETAEMPSFYPEGEYDLAGFAVGVVEKDRIINGSQIKAGDAVIGLASNGLHSNGYSLVRHLLFDINKFNVNDTWDNSGMKLSEELLKPTRIYVKPVLEILAQYSVKGMVHITGGGLPGNIKRVIPDGLMASIHIALDSVPKIFHFLMELGNIEFMEMCSTFNMGTGFVLIVDRNDEKTIIDLFGELGEKASTLGYVEQTNQNEKVRLI